MLHCTSVVLRNECNAVFFWSGGSGESKEGPSGVLLHRQSKSCAGCASKPPAALLPKRLAERGRIVLLPAGGPSHEQIAAALGISRQKASRWRARFIEWGRAGLENDAPGRGRKAVHGAERQALIVGKTLRSRPPQATQWSQRSPAKALDLRDRTVGRVWRAHGLKPHLLRTCKISKDPRFAEKLEEVMGLSLDAPEHAPRPWL